MKLTELLLNADVKQVTKLPTKTYEVARLSKVLGGEFTLELQAIPTKRASEIQSRNMSIDDDGKRDVNLYELQLATLSDGITNEDFSNLEVLKKYGAATKKDLFEKLFLAGEIAKISEEINKLSGYENQKTQKIVEEVKN